ncbi:major facilitator superfamily transporter protein [Rutstroemia sp. NJR-2017a BBW]|nr:major facilitator superfamily transporter protein [Rutstroemia sp. NJR-2017a BBW]
MAESIDLSSQGKPGTSSEPGEGPRGVKSWSTPVSSIDDDHNDPNGNPKKTYLTGWRLHITTLAVCLGLFLPNFEVSIVSTSLVSITNDLKGFAQSSWVVTSYLITYTGFFIVWAKLSDIFGRKITIMGSLLMFAAFSGASAGATSIESL